jgi:flagellar biosynthesis/type III secretory pathway M-ring protein FliF/YscJ
MHGVPIAAAQLPAMKAALAKANLTNYEIRGTSILVPRDQEPAYMAALVKEKALPPNFGDLLNVAVSEGTAFESSAQRELRMKVATQNELAMEICDMPGIERAGVLYDVDKRPGDFKGKVITATVSVKPVGTSQLDEERVSAIQHHVAGAIAGLEPENVTVSDLNGRTWPGDWQKRNSAGAGPIGHITAPAESIQRHVEEPAPPQPAMEPPTTNLARDAWLWMTQSWRPLALIGAALVCLLTLRSMVRARPEVAEGRTSSAGDGDSAAVTAAKPGKVPPPHWRRPLPADVVPPNEGLSKLVQDDPETAASILRNWIGQVD